MMLRKEKNRSALTLRFVFISGLAVFVIVLGTSIIYLFYLKFFLMSEVTHIMLFACFLFHLRFLFVLFDVFMIKYFLGNSRHLLFNFYHTFLSYIFSPNFYLFLSRPQFNGFITTYIRTLLFVCMIYLIYLFYCVKLPVQVKYPKRVTYWILVIFF